jgi:hypothetical protein
VVQTTAIIAYVATKRMSVSFVWLCGWMRKFQTPSNCCGMEKRAEQLRGPAAHLHPLQGMLCGLVENRIWHNFYS